MHPSTLTLVFCIIVSLAISVSGDDYHNWPVPPKSPNFRKEYDQLLFGFVEDHIYRSESQMILLMDYFDQFLANKEDQMYRFLSDEVHNEIHILEQTQQTTNEYFHSRNDWNQLESYIGQKMQDEVNLMLNYFRKLYDNIKKSMVTTTTTKTIFKD
ncbi:uncharacterized protein LOC124492055 [Dermatophagoides farinae]|uniref:uncharacterized protein LOC124492055 n=1 Tax=Dermatophagoides farinae TaxID=6954 RepID=UPI003F620E7C